MTSHTRRSRIRLAATYADCIVSRSNDRIAILSHHSQVPLLQFETNLLAGARLKMNSRKSAKGDKGRALNRRELEVQLNNLIAWEASCIGHGYICRNRLSRCHGLFRHIQIAVAELRVTKSIAKRIQRLSSEVAIGAVCHAVIFEVGQLINSLVERNRQPSGRIVFTTQSFGY